jgi:hypothetical protein
MIEPHSADDRARTFAAANRLNDSMSELGTEIQALRNYGRRNRRYIAGLAISLALDIILSVVLAFVAVTATQANDLATQNHNTQVATCESSNQSRLVTVNLWNYILDSASKNNPDAAKLKQIQDFRAYMEKAYAQRDCSLIGSGS